MEIQLLERVTIRKLVVGTLKKYHYDDPLTPFRMLLKKLDKGKSLMAVQLVLFAVTVLK